VNWLGIQWLGYLLSLGFKDADPLKQTMNKEEIKSDTTIRNIFKKAFENAGFAYIKPHNCRKTLARYAETQSPAFLNAVRQNLGHSSIDTTFSSYGQQSVADQRKNISSVRFLVSF
jgi:integrase/recombinase XerD